MEQVIFNVSDQDIDNIRKSFQVDAKSIKRDIEILRQWLAKQPHLPQNVDDNFLEKMLLTNKFRVEQAKIKIDKYFCLRNQFPEFYDKLDQLEVQNLSNLIYFMPKLVSPSNFRVAIWRVNSAIPDNYKISDSIWSSLAFYELDIKYDYNAGIYIVADCVGFTINHLKYVNMNDLAKFVKVLTQSLSMRIVAIHVINAPTFAIPLINFAKGLMTNKIVDRLKIFSDSGDLFDKVPKECLPTDIGGTAGSQKDKLKQVDQFIKENRDYLRSMKNFRCDESKRIGDQQFKGQDFGPDGTFKRINVD